MKVKVNDVELDLKPGTSAIDAVFAAGYDVPYFCSQEYMSPIGACRMCLAVVGAPRKDRDGTWILDEATGEPKIFNFPNPMATCTTAIMDGMVIDTLSEVTKKAQGGMMEMHLINHPLDCPTCDKGGACELQDRAYEYGSGLSRFVFTKRHSEKHHPLSELITLDRERCIHCKRCVRYFEEVPGDEVLDFIERGGHTFIGTAEGGLPSNFSGNITDICPVGALLDTTARFRGRNWEYDHTRSTSLDDCSGSAIIIDARTGRIERIKAALNTQVNKTWIDDGTRFGHEYVASADRIKTPLLRKNGKLEPVSWEEASNFISQKLQNLAEKEVAIVLRADATLEEGVAAKALADHLKTGQLDHFPRYNNSVIPQTPATLEDVATADAILVIGDVTEEVPIIDLRIKDALKGVTPPELMPHGVPIADLRLKERMPHNKAMLTVAAPYQVSLMAHAGRSIIYPVAEEAVLLEALAKVAAGQNVAVPGMPAEDAKALLKQLKDAKNAVIICGGLVLSSAKAAQAAAQLAKVTQSKQLLLAAMANGYGLEAINVLPSHERYAYQNMIAGSAKALMISGLNPAQSPAVAEKLRDMELLVVHDMFPSETTALAHVVLPAKSGYEKEGTVVNLEGRYLPVRAAPVDGGQAEDFMGLVRYLGEALGSRLEGRSLRSSRRQLKKLLELDLADLPDEGLIPASRQRNAVKLAPLGKDEPQGKLLIIPQMARVEYLLRNPHLHATYGDPALELHATDAAFYGLNAGDKVRIQVGGLLRHARVKLSPRVPEGVMLLPAVPEQPVGIAEVDMAKIEKDQVALEVA
ncbi:MAG: NADH dehydrogenase (quinone) subunit G [Chloroflexi bacterium AL-N5]|nr:NADH dehydrogenase (quinone) subunit G [Chloroflexi bacterium AL-N5]